MKRKVKNMGKKPGLTGLKVSAPVNSFKGVTQLIQAVLDYIDSREKKGHNIGIGAWCICCEHIINDVADELKAINY